LHKGYINYSLNISSKSMDFQDNKNLYWETSKTYDFKTIFEERTKKKD